MQRKLISGILLTVTLTFFSLIGSVYATETGEKSGEEELSPEERIEILLEADDNQASGIIDETYGQIKWVIDADWHLLVVGNGEFSDSQWDSRAPWYDDSYYLKSAEFYLEDITDLSYLLRSAYVETVDLSGIDTSRVTNMTGMLDGCSNMKKVNLEGFDTSRVTSMREMFENCHKLQELDLSGFDTSNVTDMSSMFYQCNSLGKLDIKSFDTSNVTNMNLMFAYCKGLENIEVGHFCTENVISMSNMFVYCEKVKSLDVSKFDVSKVKNMGAMFAGCYALEKLNLSGFNLMQAEVTERFLSQCYNLSEIQSPVNCLAEIELPLMSEYDYWHIPDGTTIKYLPCENAESVLLQRVHIIAKGRVYEAYGKISWIIDAAGKLTIEGTGDAKQGEWSTPPWYEYREEIKSAEINVENMKDASFLFYECENMKEIELSGLDTSKITNMEQMFCRCRSLENLDLSGFDTSNVINMCSMFNTCTSLKAIVLGDFNTDNVTDIRGMFSNCESLESVDVSGFNTKNVIYMNNMFENCRMLKQLDVSRFDTGNVTDIFEMFRGCRSLESLDVRSFDVQKITELYGMFKECESLTELDLSHWNTEQVTTMESMFEGCASLETLNLSGFQTNKVQIIAEMFQGCSSLEEIIIPKRCQPEIWLPKASENDKWYLFDGTTTDIVPKDTYSMTIFKNRIPESPEVYQIFEDVYEKEWYVSYIQYVFENKLMKGEANSLRFKPDEPITKAQVAQVLYNMAGAPEVSDFSVCENLKDVYYGEWYDDAVSWAYRKGVITGDLNKKMFYPNEPVTREQLALMFYRYALVNGEASEVDCDFEGMKNAENVSNWADTAVRWAVGTDLISGIEIKDGKEFVSFDLAPQGTATRAQVAAILMRYCEK